MRRKSMSNTAETPAEAEVSILEGIAHEQETINESYNLNMPEGMELTPDQRALFDAQAQELKLDNDGAQKLLEISRRNQVHQTDAHNKQIKTWQEEIRQDKELGGTAFESTVAYARAGLSKFDPQSKLFEILEHTGYGNNPHVIRFLAAIGRAHAEDKIILGSPSKTEAPRHERLYGKYNSL